MIYHINPEKRAVCCRMPVHENGHALDLWEEARNQAMAKLNRYLRGNANDDLSWALNSLVSHIFERRMGGVEYYGVARCHPKDEFDEEKGKEIARNKALMSYYKDMRMCMYEVCELFGDLSSMAFDKAEECYCYEERLAIRQENF